MKRFKLAALTAFALPFPLLAVMLSVHCHGAGFPASGPEDSDLSIEHPGSRVSVAAGQSITSLMLGPAVLQGGEGSTGTISLRYPAPAGGLVVSLQNNDKGKLDLPAQVVVAEGKTTGKFHLSTRPVRDLVSLNISATYQNASATTLVTLLPASNRQWFASSGGTRAGNGSRESPWDLATALQHGPRRSDIRPGDTIWLRGGVYKGTFVSLLSGTESRPIIVRSMPGERVVIDKAEVNAEKQPALKVKGSWVWFWGIEITNSSPDRRRNSPYTGRDQPWRGSGADVYAPHVKFINMIFHDNGQGIWDKQDMTEIHGCLFYYNGNNKREHGLYIGNRTGTKYVTDNILFAQGGYGILSHSDSSASSQKGLHLEGNVSFNNGVLTQDDQKTGNLQVGGVQGEAAERIVVKNNYIYNTATNASSKNVGIRLGYEDHANRDVELVNNYIVSRTPLLLWWWQSARVEGNTLYSTGGDLVELRTPEGFSHSSYKWNFNKYFSVGGGAASFVGDDQAYGFTRWRQSTQLDQQSQLMPNSRPEGAQIFIRPNRYEPGRTHIVVFNWIDSDQIAIDVDGILKPGTSYEIRDAQNYFAAPVMRGIYKGGQLVLPMKLSNVSTPIGNVERQPRHTSSEFGVFVLQTLPVNLAR
ncbi:MAG TPA: hypothetical protein VJU86_14035 [Pyrinomonadaceae bacterium]|nr:hypothetical protein [Pyrinomonadaceae bacterium]